MKINESLNLVVPVRSDDKGTIIHAYHSPISREVFEANYRVLAATKSSLTAKGVHFLMDTGPRIASLTLRDEGKKDAADRGELDARGNPLDGGASALEAEIKRLTTILAPSPTGWKNLPVDIAIAQGVIDAEEWDEAASGIAFFTCHFAMAPRANRKRIADATASVLQGSITSSSLSEFVASLPRLTPEESSAPKAGYAVAS